MIRELALAESIVETVREPLILLDEKLGVIRVNRSFFKTFRVAANETSGRPLRELGDGQWNIPKLLTLLDKIISSGDSFEDFEVVHDFPGIGRRVMLLNARLLRQAEDDGRLVLLAIEDITVRRELEEKLKRQSEALARSNRDLEEFAYVASHDLQEPLRMVVSFTQLLSRRYKGRLDAEADEFIAFAVDGAKRMQRLINDLLAYSRLDRREAGAASASAADAVEAALASLQTLIKETEARVEVGPLPLVRVDPGQLGQLFQNLIGNAIKFRAPDRPPVIRIGAERDGTLWRFRVEDNGIGVDPRYFEKVFVIFERLHGMEVPGTGIGLALCRKIVGRHGGKIWIESEKGRGAVLCFTLPHENQGK